MFKKNYKGLVRQCGLVIALGVMGLSSTARAMDLSRVESEPAPITFPENFRSPDFQREKRELLENTPGCPSLLNASGKIGMSIGNFQESFITFLNNPEQRTLALRLLDFDPTETPNPSQREIERNYTNLVNQWQAFLEHTKVHGEWKDARSPALELIPDATWVFQAIMHANDMLIHQLLTPARITIASKIGARYRGKATRNKIAPELAAHKEKGRAERAAKTIQRVRRGNLARKRARIMRAEKEARRLQEEKMRAEEAAGAARLERIEHIRLHRHDAVDTGLAPHLQAIVNNLQKATVNKMMINRRLKTDGITDPEEIAAVFNALGIKQ